MSKLNHIQKYVWGVILYAVLHHFITLFGPGILYEIYLSIVTASSSTENSWLIGELNWKYPFNAILISIFFIFYYFPLDLTNLTIMFSFFRLDKKLNRSNRWWMSIVLFFLSISIAYTLGACSWGLISWWDIGLDAMDKFEVLRPGASSNLIHIVLGNFIFMLIFLPFWHYKLKIWSTYL